MSVSPVSEMPSNAELSAFCHDHVGERPSSLRQRLSIATARGGRIEQLVTDSREPLALGAMYRQDDRVTITVLRSAAGQRSYTAVRQMAHHLRAIVAKGGPATVACTANTEIVECLMSSKCSTAPSAPGREVALLQPRFSSARRRCSRLQSP